ncbi:hypothetical protein KKF34_04635 [Myxococcota bacterium]|nr:hypothetical protein [Myxococcota bacterium]MBU1380204.1 hypothetical protein [Myxococcota bacterium]MBU1496146.1 hypothetical protein [Myxococcota bacterium]
MSKIVYSYINAEEKAQAALNAAKKCLELWIDDAVIKTLSEDVIAKAEKTISTIGPKNEKPLTEELNRIERLRDNAFRSAVNYLESISILPGYEHIDMAEELLNIMIPDGIGFLSESYIAETAILNQRIGILTSEELKQTVETLNFAPWINAIERTNNDFLQSLDKRNDVRVARTGATSKSVTSLNLSIKALWATVEAKKGNENAVAVFSDFFTAMTSARSRRSRKNNPTSPETPDTPTE